MGLSKCHIIINDDLFSSETLHCESLAERVVQLFHCGYHDFLFGATFWIMFWSQNDSAQMGENHEIICRRNAHQILHRQALAISRF